MYTSNLKIVFSIGEMWWVGGCSKDFPEVTSEQVYEEHGFSM